MQIEYDENKRLKTLTERGLDFKDAVHVFSMPTLDYISPQAQHLEERIVSIGLLGKDKVAVIWTQRGEKKRIISMRKARDNERASYARTYLEI